MKTRMFAIRAARLFPLAAFTVAGGCFATRNDVRVVQSDLASFRTEVLKSNAEQRESMAVALRTLSVASDSVKVMSTRLTSVQGNVLGGLRDVNEQLIEVQELLKQSQSKLEQYRREQEIRANQAAMIPFIPPTTGVMPPFGGGVSDTVGSGARMPTSAAVGPLELYNSGRQQFARGSYATAREIFQEFLSTYPSHDRAAAAQLGIAQSFESEKSMPSAMATYGAVVQKYPDSPEAATALWKHAGILIDLNRPEDAKLLLRRIVDRYKTSDVYQLATDKLKTMK